ncbi:MAG: aldo/keto reductase [Anaerolineae bacterium]|nr:aldo/keto reductase [Anaerolineae bacterium]
MDRSLIPQTDLAASRLALGCMNLASWDRNAVTSEEKQRAVAVASAAFEAGINVFDHADIYAYGKSEAVFAAVWQAIPREEVILQSKCGIILPGDPRYHGPGRYDFSYDHIIGAVEGSLSRLETDYLDVLLLHRPDPLMEPEEVAAAFDALETSGKVRYFGVSNFNAWQMELLQNYLDQPLVVNQLELSLLHPHLVHEGIIVNQSDGPHALATGVLDYCRLNEVLVQAWSPVAQGRMFDPPGDAAQEVQAVAEHIAALANDKGTTREAIALAWILRHPAGIQPVIGTTRPERVRASVLAEEVTLGREEWYELLIASRGAPVP